MKRKILPFLIAIAMSVVLISLNADAAAPPKSPTYYDIGDKVEHYHVHDTGGDMANNVGECYTAIKQTSGTATHAETCSYHISTSDSNEWDTCGICGQKTVHRYAIIHDNPNCPDKYEEGWYKTCGCGNYPEPTGGSHTITVMGSSTTITYDYAHPTKVCKRDTTKLLGTFSVVKEKSTDGYFLKLVQEGNIEKYKKKKTSGGGITIGQPTTPSAAINTSPDQFTTYTCTWSNACLDDPYIQYAGNFVYKTYGDENKLEVKKNGTYYCKVIVNDAIDANNALVIKNGAYVPEIVGNVKKNYYFRVEISDFDSEAPTVTPTSENRFAITKKIEFALTDNISLKSFKVAGCDIEKTFTYDEGTLEKTEEVIVTENGVLNYDCEDAAGNHATGVYYVRTIDDDEPEIIVNNFTPKWTQEQTVTATIKDTAIKSIKVDGKFINLNASADESSIVTYNVTPAVENFYDSENSTRNGNNTFNSTNIVKIGETDFNPVTISRVDMDLIFSKNGTYHIEVQDALDRVKEADITISNIDRTPPVPEKEILYKSGENYLENNGKEAEVNYTFNDIDTTYEDYEIFATCPEVNITNEAVTNPYTLSFTENGVKGVVFSDKAGNYKADSTTIGGIDTTPPTISVDIEYEREEEPRYATATITTNDDVSDVIVNVYLEGNLLGELEGDTFIIRQNGNYKFEAVDTSENKSYEEKPVFKIVQAYTLDEEAEVSHSHSLSGGVCYKTTQTTITHVHTADCYTVTYCNQPIPETRGPGFEEGDERSYCCNGHVGGCGTTCHHEMSNTLTCTIPKTKKITKSVLDCDLDTLGSLYLRQNTEGGYKLYIENPDNLTISEYRWTGTDTAKSTHAGGNASDVNTVTTNEILVPDYGDYECIATVTDSKSNNPIEIKFFYTVENFDVEAPSVSYRVTSVDNDSNTLDFTFTDNMSLGELKEGTHLLKTLTGKTANISLDLSREEHSLTLTDAFGNATEFTVYKDYLKDMTVKDESEAQIKIAGYPINYETDGTLQAKGSIVGYALNDGNGYGDYQSSGNFTVYGNGDYQIKEIDTLNNELVYSVNIDGLTGTWPVTYIDKTDKGVTLNSVTKHKKIGTTAGGNELGTNTDLSKYYEGYRYTTSTTLVVTAGVENIVYRYFKIEVFDLEYYDDKGNNLANEKVEYGGRNANTLIPKKNSIVEDSYTIDYYFAYWADQTGKEVDLNRITKSMKLYPVFNEVRSDSIHSVTFYFDYQNDKTWCESYEVPHKSSVIPPSAEKEPTEKYTYQFMYWTTANGVAVYDFSSIESDMEYFAYWLETEIPPEPMEIKDTSEVIEREAEILTIEPPEVKSREVEIKDKATPKNALMNFYEDNKETIKAVGTGVGITAGLLGLGEIICLILTGFGLIQLGIFLWALLRKKKRYIQGAWLTNEPDTQYVDKHGRSISINDGIYTNGEDILMAVDVNKEIEKLNRGAISYSGFRQNIKMSEVYTVFDENLEIECSNIKNTYKSKVKGFDIIKNLKNFIKVAGSYKLKLKNGKDEFLYTLSVAMNGSKI